MLEQNHFAYDEQRILDTVMAGKAELWAAMDEKETLLAGEVDDAVGVRLGELEGIIAEHDGYSAESEAAELLVGLGIPAEKHADPMRTLAAGYKLRVLIAQGALRPAGRAAPRRADEPPRPRVDPLARAASSSTSTRARCSSSRTTGTS